jgi:transcriptional regulator with XRE-family HTH domain
MIYRKIRQLRKQLGFTQAAMARNLCISQNAYSLIERGITRIDIERLLQISKLLNIPVSELIDLELTLHPEWQ